MQSIILICLSPNHREVIHARVPETRNKQEFRKIIKNACGELGLSLSDHTVRRVVEGESLNTNTEKKLITILGHLKGLGNIVTSEWLSDPLARVDKGPATIAASVDHSLDAYAKFQYEIERLRGLYVVYRRHSSGGVAATSTEILIRELLFVKGGTDHNTDAYFVTKQGGVYKGRGLRYKDIWKFDFFRVRRQAMVVSRSIKLQADSAALKRKMIGGVMLRTTDSETEASACDVLAIALSVDSGAPELGDRIVSAYENKQPLFASSDAAPPTMLRKDKMAAVEKNIYKTLKGTIVAPTEVSEIILEDVYQTLPVADLQK